MESDPSVVPIDKGKERSGEGRERGRGGKGQKSILHCAGQRCAILCVVCGFPSTDIVVYTVLSAPVHSVNGGDGTAHMSVPVDLTQLTNNKA